MDMDMEMEMEMKRTNHGMKNEPTIPDIWGNRPNQTKCYDAVIHGVKGGVCACFFYPGFWGGGFTA